MKYLSGFNDLTNYFLQLFNGVRKITQNDASINMDLISNILTHSSIKIVMILALMAIYSSRNLSITLVKSSLK